MKIKTVAGLAMSLVCLLASPLAQAQNAAGQQALYNKSLAASCANCHGTNGKAAEGSSVSGLAGLDPAFIVAQMKAFKSGTRQATVMHQISKGYSDAQIESLASFFAAQKK
ncbi:Cytochrome c553 [Polaromonas sp. OV174]|uniref:c-type cytochrome n=1 Tax=Polaromonas sp. OV174 TaxID=1855300 RepID=UPI0008E82852|nr:c-type cytochrome [Polaromonas sp. OV174]SFC76238.1 Cytochrome c553 [Polaromonas sp. OV174]